MSERLRGLLLIAASLLPIRLCAEPLPLPPSAPVVSILIDDIGYRRDLGERAVELPRAVTLAMLPNTPHGPALAEAAVRGGHEVVLHLPMEADDAPLDAGGLTLALSRDELAARVNAALDEMPQAVGVNNHMGSLLTRYALPMRWLMEVIDRRGGLYFIDSRTTVETVAEAAAAAQGLPRARRDLFLDNDRDRVQIRRQFQRLIELAHERRSALAIGHPYPETLDVLAEMLPELTAAGIDLVPVSELLARQAAGRLQATSAR